MQLPKATEDRRKDGEGVLMAGEMYLPRIRKGFDHEFGPGFGEGATAFASQMLGETRRRLEAMVAAADRRVKEGLDLTQLRPPRDDYRDRLHAELVRIRDTARIVYGEPFVQNLGLAGRMGTTPEEVYRQAGQVLEYVKTVPVPEGDSSLTLDWDDLLAPARELYPKLGDALKQMARETKEEDLALADKNLREREYDVVFKVTADLLSNLLETVGEDELARKVRPSGSKPGRTSGDLTDLTPAGGDDAPAAEEAEG